MVNEINGLTSTITTGTGKNRAAWIPWNSRHSQSVAEAASDAPSDNFELSTQAQLLSKLEATISRLPEVD